MIYNDSLFTSISDKGKQPQRGKEPERDEDRMEVDTGDDVDTSRNDGSVRNKKASYQNFLLIINK
jgi:hypothetical protein